MIIYNLYTWQWQKVVYDDAHEYDDNDDDNDDDIIMIIIYYFCLSIDHYLVVV